MLLLIRSSREADPPDLPAKKHSASISLAKGLHLFKEAFRSPKGLPRSRTASRQLSPCAGQHLMVAFDLQGVSGAADIVYD